MRAIQITRFGGPEVLELGRRCPSPDARPGDCRVFDVDRGRGQLRRHPPDRGLLPRPADSCRWSRAPRSSAPTPDGAPGRRPARPPAATPSGSRPTRRLTCRSRTGSSDGAALAVVLQGTTAWHLLRTCAHLRRGRVRRGARRAPAGSARSPSSWPGPGAPGVAGSSHEHVKGCAGDVAALERIMERGLIDQAAARAVDDAHALSVLGYIFGVQDVAGSSRSAACAA